MSPCSIRPATAADAAAINAILDPYIRHSTATFMTEPWTLEQRRAWFEEHHEKHPVLVAECDGVVVGFGSLSTFRSRAAYAATAEVAVYLREDYHRRGIGRRLLATLEERARALGHHVLIGVCCAETHASIALLEARGFARVGHLREVGRKFGRWLDLVVLQLVLAEPVRSGEPDRPAPRPTLPQPSPVASRRSP